MFLLLQRCLSLCRLDIMFVAEIPMNCLVESRDIPICNFCSSYFVAKSTSMLLQSKLFIICVVEQLLTFADLKQMDTISSTASEICIYMYIYTKKRGRERNKNREREDTTRHLHGCFLESLCLLAYLLGKSVCLSKHINSNNHPWLMLSQLWFGLSPFIFVGVQKIWSF